MVICLERGADLHTAQMMPLSLTVSCFRKIQIGVTFLVPAHLGSPERTAVKWVCVLCVSVCVRVCLSIAALRFLDLMLNLGNKVPSQSSNTAGHIANIGAVYENRVKR